MRKKPIQIVQSFSINPEKIKKKITNNISSLLKKKVNNRNYFHFHQDMSSLPSKSRPGKNTFGYKNTSSLIHNTVGATQNLGAMWISIIAL